MTRRTRITVPPGWAKQRNALVRIHKFDSFVDAMSFVMQLAFYAESVDHHPDLKISYRTVTIEWTSHDAGGVTKKDVAGAKFTNTLITP
jgi:4a-hydroxytetrahydrobiopterin dehydratase